MDDRQLLKELNKILTLEHGHLGMYKNYLSYQDKDIRRTFRRFMEIESEHIAKLNGVIRNLGGKPSMLIDAGDVIGRFLGITMNMTSNRDIIKTYSLVEKKSHQGYQKLVSKLEQSSKTEQFIAEITASNMLEAKLMHLWLEEKLGQM